MFSRLTLWATLLLALVPLSAQAQKPVLTTLYRFKSADGGLVEAPLTVGRDGNLYGVSFFGNIFTMTPEGKYSAVYPYIPGADQSVLQGQDGAFYGVTEFGGPQDEGTVYRLAPGGKPTVLHAFSYVDGRFPRGKLVQGSDGNFYGTTSSGGLSDVGVVYKMSPAGAVTVLHSFNYTGGAYPFEGVVFGPDGALYGTAYNGGKNNVGVVFRLTTDGAAFRVLHSFRPQDGDASDGLTLGPDGALYGTLRGGGIGDSGGIYKITTDAVFTTLHKFSADGHGIQPYSGLTLGPDGNFYGTTGYGGTKTAAFHNGAGTVFQMTPAGGLTTLYKFHTAFDGALPFGGVVFAPNGLLYGATRNGGAKKFGTLYSLSVPAAN